MPESEQLFPRQRAFLDAGLFVIRMGLGIMFMIHGWSKIAGGTEVWTRLGGAMSLVGIDFVPAFWGFMASFAEFGGGLALVLGIFFRPMVILLLITMIVATVKLASVEEPSFTTWSRPLELAIVFVGLLITGPGKAALGRLLFKARWWS